MKRELKKWCERNSKPRKIPKQPKISRGKTKPLAKMLPRIMEICQPGPRYQFKQDSEEADAWFMVKKSSLRYKASPRIKLMAEPRMRGDFIPQLTQEEAFRISPRALKYKISPRTEEMAKPNPHKIYKKRRDRFFEVKPGALKYTASPRIIEIAVPIIHKGHRPRVLGKVAKAALTATATPRILIISQPIQRVDKNYRKPVVSKAALSYVATENIIKISKPSHITPKYVAPSEDINSRPKLK